MNILKFIFTIAIAAGALLLTAQTFAHTKPGPNLDRIEDYFDRREDRREDYFDRREDRIDALSDNGRRDRLEDIFDRREDRRDRAEDIRDRHEDIQDRRN